MVMQYYVFIPNILCTINSESRTIKLVTNEKRISNGDDPWEQG